MLNGVSRFINLSNNYNVMMSVALLKRIVEEQREEVNSARIKPRQIFKEVEKAMELKEVTVLSGVRRAGKTYIMYHLARKFDGVYVNFEDERLMQFDLSDFDKLYNLSGRKPLLLDEVHNVKGWEKFVRRVHNKTKVVVSGSNSQLLSSEYATVLTGRTITFDVFPLTYSEFLEFKEVSPSIHSFERYMDLGGFPRIVETERQEFIREYFNMIIYKDVLPRFSIKYGEFLKDLAVYLLSNIGKPFTYRSLTKVVGIKHEMTVKEYIKHLESSYLLYTIQKYHPSFRIREAAPKKVYAVDSAFAKIGIPDISLRSRLLENIVYIHLMQQFGRENVFYSVKEHEVDFLITKNLKPKIAFNVSYSITDSKTLKREIKGLLELRKGIRRYLITLYPLDFDLPEEIEHIPAVDFLSNAQSIEQK